VHRRTIFRDLDMLREAGVPVDYDQESESYSVAGSVAFREAQLDAHEALALLTLCQQLGGKQGLPFLGAARSAALKLESTLPPQLRDYSAKRQPRRADSARAEARDAGAGRHVSAGGAGDRGAAGHTDSVPQPDRVGDDSDEAAPVPRVVQPAELVRRGADRRFIARRGRFIWGGSSSWRRSTSGSACRRGSACGVICGTPGT
jgi:hypothetical protein